MASYAANTHNGTVRTYNEDRVSIILNILRECSAFLILGSQELNKILNIFFIFLYFKKSCLATSVRKKEYQLNATSA